MNKDEKKRIDDALCLLENSGYSTSRPLLESGGDLVDTIKAKYDEYMEKRHTSESFDLYDELINTYGYDLVETVVDHYDEIKKGDMIDMTDYLSNADRLYPEFFDIMKKIGMTKFVVDAEHAFYGKTKYFIEACMNNVSYSLYAPEVKGMSYPIVFTIKNP